MLERKKLSTHQRILGITLLLLILGSSILLFVVLRSNGKATGQPGDVHKTVTPILSPTLSLTPQPLFSDTFLDNKKGWYTGTVVGYTRKVEAGALILTDTNHTVLTESLPINDTFADITLTAAFTLVNADANDSVGLYVRGDSNLDHDYRFEVFGNNTYAISKEYLDSTNRQQVISLSGPLHSSYLRPLGQENTFTVMTKGPTLVLLINGSIVNSFNDVDYKRGQIALFVANGATSDGVTASFSSISVYPAPEKLPK